MRAAPEPHDGASLTAPQTLDDPPPRAARPKLVVLGATSEVARAVRSLDADVVHVQLPGAATVDVGAGTRTTTDYRDLSTFLPFVDEVLRPLDPSAVVSLTELGLEPAAAAAERLGVVGTPTHVVRAMRHKLTMRRVLARRAPHLNPAFAPGDAAGEVEELFARHSPVVAKPVDGSGSSDVSLLHELADLPPDRRTRHTLLEQFVGGREYSVESLSSSGRHTVIGIAQKGTTTGFVELSHVMPPHALDERQRQLVERAVVELLDALGLTDGPSHTEVKVDGDRAVVIETHNRLGGDGIADLVRLTRGIDWRRSAAGWAVGAGVERHQPSAPAAATVFFTAPPGRVTAVAERPRLTHGSVVDWRVSVRAGDVVHPLRSSLDRLGCATLTAPSPSACAAAVAELTAVQVVTTAPLPAGSPPGGHSRTAPIVRRPEREASLA